MGAGVAVGGGVAEVGMGLGCGEGPVEKMTVAVGKLTAPLSAGAPVSALSWLSVGAPVFVPAPPKIEFVTMAVTSIHEHSATSMTPPRSVLSMARNCRLVSQRS